MTTLKRKNKFLLVSDVLAIVMIIVLLIYPFTGFRQRAWYQFGYQFFIRLMELGLSACMIGVVEVYMFDYGFLRGYVLGLSGNAMTSTTTEKRTTRSKSAPSSIETKPISSSIPSISNARTVSSASYAAAE
jgi:hypothetical protein